MKQSVAGTSSLETDTNRRRIIKSVAGIVAGFGTVGRGMDSDSDSDTINIHQNQERSYTNTSNPKTMNNRTAYLAVPGISFTSIVANVPQLLNHSCGAPIIIMDSHDYKRFRRWIQVQKGWQKAHYLGLIYDELRRRDILKFVDYGKYYSEDSQEENIRQNQALISATPNHTIRRAATGAAEGYTHHTLGDYQQSLRSNINDIGYTEYRRKIERQQRKIERGTGNARLWNERLVNQYMAAVEVSRNFNVQYIIGQGEFSSINTILNASTRGIDTRDVPPVYDFDLTRTSLTREILNRISTIATDVADVQHDDWFVFGPRLAMPSYYDLFASLWANMRVGNIDDETVGDEAKEILALLNTEAADERSVQHVQAEANWLSEEYSISPRDQKRLLGQIETAVDLANHSRDLRSVADSGRYSPASVFLAASIKMDPVYQFNHSDVYRRAAILKNQLQPVTATDAHVEKFRNRGDIRIGESDKEWYEVQKNRWR